ncbi:MAG: glycosyltransferase [Mucilaginibacter sp.]|nr:glycosyltransferase [Mucilaginibacter sp.]
MRIAILINELNIRGGTHKQVHRLADYLLEQGHDVKVITKYYDPNKCYPGIEKFTVYSFDRYFDENKGFISKKINALIGSIKMASTALLNTDCINIHDTGLNLANLLIKLRKPTMPVVWQINDLPSVFTNLKPGNDSFLNGLRKAYNRYIAKKNDVITVNVTKNAERVKLSLGIHARVLYCGVDLRNTKIKKNIIDQKNIVLLSTGVFFPYRNYETFLKVQSILQAKGYAVTSSIIGSTDLDPAYADKIRDLSNQLNLACDILGDIPEKQLINLYNKANFFLFLNIDQSWGLSVFEAMNLCIPAIVSKSVGATELLDDNFNAIIEEPTDATAIADRILSLIQNEAVKDKLIENAFESTLQMTWAKMYCARVEAIFSELIK